jgi:Sulfotransferase domain
MHVIGAGLPRTGTLSQKAALEMLGLGPCYHWVDVIADLRRVEEWDRALDGDAPWEQIFAGFNSTVDWPGGHFFRELTEAYPEAKVILSTREPQAWETSFRETIWNMCFGESLTRLLAGARAQIDPQWERYLALVDRMFWTGPVAFAPRHAEPADLIAAMERHNEAVKDTVPPDRLLVWNFGDGWKPLCEFLGLPVPDEALPHLNDRATFHERVIGGAIGALSAWHQQQQSAGG